jgi:DNA-binding NarL/FixJ family response regulator
VGSIVRDRLPSAGPAFVTACHGASAGNPFLLGALLDHLVAERVEPTDEVAAGLSGFGPEQVARAVDRQLTRLPAGTAELARAFAVLGRGAALRHARDLAGLDHERALRLADRLRDAGLIGGGSGGYALVHPLVEAALYTGLPVGERALWHGRAARLLEHERADPETVALHLLRTEPAGEPATVTALRTAADRAWRRGAPQNAATFLRRALAEPPAAPYDEAELLSRLGLVNAEQVKPQAYDLLADAVALAADPEQRARIALAGTRALGLAGFADEALHLARRALDRVAGADLEVVERLEAEMVCNAWLDAAEVADARERTNRPHVLPLWMVHRGHLAACAGRPATEVAAILRAGLDVDADSLLGTQLKFCLVATEELDTVRALCDALIEVARPRGWMTALAHGSFVRAHALIQAGRVREAVTDARFAFEFKLANPPAPGLVWTLFPLVEALVEADDLDGAEAALAAAARVGSGAGEAVPGKLRTAMLLERRARLWLARHRPAEAHTDLLAAAGTWQALDVRHPGLAAWRVDDSAALAALGDLDAARRLAGEHLELAARVGLPGPRGAGLRALAHTVAPAEAVPLLTQAAHVLAGSAARLEHARVLVELGAALRRANQRTTAREPLVRALDLADRGGMRLIAARARQELLAAGGRPRRSVVSGPGALTPAEHRVAVLAALGHSNREIADQLYVTRRTVETHLTHIFQKLSVTNRAQLATSLPEPIG